MNVTDSVFSSKYEEIVYQGSSGSRLHAELVIRLICLSEVIILTWNNRSGSLLNSLFLVFVFVHCAFSSADL